MPTRAVLLCLALLAAPAAGEDVSRDLGTHFPGFRSALVVRDVAAGRTVRHGPALARERTSPCSTFKIPNSIIGLETGVIPDASFVLQWDGVQRPVAEWNRDHDLRSAMKHSVVWYYQELARRVGAERMRKRVSALRYGNGDTSGGPDGFWLGSSLRISPDEQVDFLARLYAGELAASPRSIAVVKDLLVQEPPGAGDRLPWKDGLVPGPRRNGAARVVGGVGRERGAALPLRRPHRRTRGLGPGLPADGREGARRPRRGAGVLRRGRGGWAR